MCIGLIIIGRTSLLFNISRLSFWKSNYFLSIWSMTEIWKDIQGYEGLYQVSSLGRVRSLDREIIYSNGHRRVHRGKILSFEITRNGYVKYELSEKSVRKYPLGHILVAEAFLPNPDNLPQINHKNEIKTDNRVENLEWCTPKYNLEYNDRYHRFEHHSPHMSTRKPVILSKNGVEYKFDSAKTAGAELGLDNSAITKCCKGKIATTKGYSCRYA